MVLPRRALFDNSTLSAVERLLALSETKNRDNIDHDIACYEKLVNGILFYDELFLIDDYKPYYRDRRKKTFYFLNEADVSDEQYQILSEDAARFAAEQRFEVSHGEPIGQTLKFFEQLLLKPQVRWDIFVSSEYLTLSYLVDNDDEKQLVGPALAACGNELADAHKVLAPGNHEMLLFDRSESGNNSGYTGESVGEFMSRLRRANKNSKGSGNRDTLDKVVFAYGWVVERTRFYENLGRELDLSPILSPLRDAYALSSIGMSPFTFQENFLGRASNESIQVVREAAALTDCTSLKFKLPFFSAWLLSKTANPREALELALAIRERQEFRSVRDQLSNLTHLSPVDRKTEVASIVRSIRVANSAILEKYTTSTSNGPALGISIGFAGPSLDVSAAVGGLFSGFRGGPIARTYRSLAADLIAVERLGVLHDKMTSLVHASRAGYASFSTTPGYMRRRSGQYSRPVD